MNTKAKTFDAVAASRQWRADAGRRLDAMTVEERLAFLEGLRARGAAAVPSASFRAVREDEADYGAKPEEIPLTVGEDQTPSGTRNKEAAP